MTFEGSINIAMKIPAAQFDRTVAFYRDVLELPTEDVTGTEIAAGVARSVGVEFGPCRLWLDEVPNYARSDVWLELATDDVPAAMERLAAAGITARDELEPLPDSMGAHWIANPAGVVHLVRSSVAAD